MRRGLIYNIALFFVVLTVATEAYIVLGPKRVELLYPDPVLGTYAQEVFQTVGQGELVQISLANSGKDALCESYGALGGRITDDLAKPVLDNYKSALFLAFEKDVSLRLSEDAKKMAFSPQEIPPFKLYLSDEKTYLFGTAPWRISRATKQGDVVMYVSPRVDIPVKVNLDQIVLLVQELKSIPSEQKFKETCAAGTEVMKGCIAERIEELKKKYPGTQFTLSYPEEASSLAPAVISRLAFTIPAPSGCSAPITAQSLWRFSIVSGAVSG